MDHQNSLKEIYDEYKNLVFNLSLNYVQNVQDAEEITQDVFVKIHKSRHNFKQRSKVSTWIYRITINSCLDFIKAKNAQKRKAVFASLAICVVVNIMVVGSHFRKSKTENANTFIEQMHLSSSNIYYKKGIYIVCINSEYGSTVHKLIVH